MINIENVDVYGWEAAIRGMRNPMNSWDKSDSFNTCGKEPVDSCEECQWCAHPNDKHFKIGDNDLGLMMQLANGGSVHAKYRRMITVTVDITAPLYWWKEFDTYKVGTVANSCSTMHKIHDKEFTLNDFSHEHLDDTEINAEYDLDGMGGTICITGTSAYTVLVDTVAVLNAYRKLFLETNDKKYWWQMIQLLPSSYNQRRTVQLNYEVLTNMYHARKVHKLDEWVEFCKWIETLPYFKELVLGD